MRPNDRQNRLQRQQLIKLFVFFSVLILGFVGLVVVNNLLISFVIAIVVSYLVFPLTSYLEGSGLSRLTAIIIVYSFFTVLFGIAVWSLTPFFSSQLVSLKEGLPRYVDGAVRALNEITSSLESSTGGLIHIDLSDRVRDWLTKESSLLVEGLPGFLSSSASVIFLSPLLGFFILKDGQAFSRSLLKLVPNNIFELTLSLQHQISEQIGQFIRARLFETAIVSLVVLIGLWLIGFPYAILLAIFAGVANLIPYIGPLVGAAPGIVIAFSNQSSQLGMLLLILVYVIAQIVDNFIVIPIVVARIVNLHPITVIIAVILGAEVMGVLGMLISIPVAATLKVTFKNVYDHLTDYTV